MRLSSTKLRYNPIPDEKGTERVLAPLRHLLQQQLQSYPR